MASRDADPGVSAVGKPDTRPGKAQTLRDYWTGHGHGGPTHHAFEKAIAWGTPGDFDRCVAMLTTHGKMSPEQAKGYCNLRHHEALGFWPAQHAEMERGGKKHASLDLGVVDFTVAEAALDQVEAALVTGAWDPSKHPRVPAGSPTGGEFALGGKGAAPTNQNPVGEGESGQRVTNLQERLKQLGFYKGKIDGQAGDQTKAAIEAYQKAHGLKVDGLVGPKTTAALRLDKGGKSTAHHRKTKKQTKPKETRKPGDVFKTLSPGMTVSGAVPQLVTIPGVDLMAAGTWELSSGKQTFTRDDLTNAIEAAKCPAVGDPVIKLGHIDPRFDGQPAIGRVANMRTDDSGMKLLGDLANMPGWLGEVAHAAFPRRSIEGTYNFRCQVGHTHPFVVTGLALLGVTAPGVGVLNDLPDIASLYGVHQQAQAAASPWSFDSDNLAEEDEHVAVTEEDVRRAYYATSVDPTWWISELQMHPTQLVVSSGDGKLYRVPFQIEDSDTKAIHFDDAEELADYAALTASRSGTVVTYASAAESRSVVDAADGKKPKAPYGDVEYADPGYLDEDGNQASKSGKPGQKRYPIDAGHVQAAWSYINQKDNQSGYTPEQLSSIMGKIKAAMKKHGHDVSDDSKAASVLDGTYDPVTGEVEAGASSPPSMDGDDVTGDVNNDMMSHGACSTTHAHGHSAYGSQGGDASHSHRHNHSGDNDHNHSHANAGAGKRKGSDVEFTADQTAALRKALCVDEENDLDAETLVAATAKLREQADAKVAASKRQLPPGVITVEEDVWKNTLKKVEAAEKFRQRTLDNERDEVIDQAVRSGKFSASRKPHWQRVWDADPNGTREIIAGLTPNVVPVDDIGTSGGTLDDEEFNRDYARIFPPSSR